MATENSVMAVLRASRPFFRNANDKIAFLVHSTFLSAGYSLIATGNRALNESPTTFSGQQEVGIDGWNELDDCYGFVYSKTEKGKKITALVKCLVVGDYLVVDVLNVDDNQREPMNLQIKINDYVKEGDNSNNYGEMYTEFGKLVNSLNTSILNKLESTPPASSTSSLRMETHGVDNTQNPMGYSSESPPHNTGLEMPPIPLFGGFSDLYPGAGAGFYPPRVGSGMGGSMLVGPNDPRWMGGIGRGPGFTDGIPGIPPGARFDPYGPPGVPGFEPNRFIRNPRRPSGDTHPDLEFFRGPDYN